MRLLDYLDRLTADDRAALDTLRFDVDRIPAIRLLAGIEVDPSTGCWLWQHSTTLGYGRIRIGGRLDLCHRVAYRMWVGDLIDGMQIDHVRDRGCLNRHCCNPAHLEQVTPIVNQLRASPRLTHCHRGHEFTPANRAPRRDGRNDCRECRNMNQRASRAARREVAAA